MKPDAKIEGLYGRVPIALIASRKLRNSARVVYCALSSFQGNNADCFPSVQKIMQRITDAGGRISRRSVFYAIAELHQLGWITKRSGSGRANRYVVHMAPVQNHEIIPQASALGGAMHSCTSGVQNSPIEKRTIKENLKEQGVVQSVAPFETDELRAKREAAERARNNGRTDEEWMQLKANLF